MSKKYLIVFWDLSRQKNSTFEFLGPFTISIKYAYLFKNSLPPSEIVIDLCFIPSFRFVNVKNPLSIV